MREARDLTEYKVDLIRENVQRAGVFLRRAEGKRCGTARCGMDRKSGRCDCGPAVHRIRCHRQKAGYQILCFKRKRRGAGTDSAGNPCKCRIVRKAGRTLLYSTCTVNRKENGENAAWFLEQFPFEAVSLDELLPDELKSGETAKGQLQLIPGVHKTDGFFLAKFRKTEEGRA